MWCSEWNICWVMHENPRKVFLAWDKACSNNKSKMWVLAFYVITWSIWLFCNEIVFNGKQWEMGQLFDLIKLRLALWGKARWPKISGKMEDLFRCPSLVSLPQQGRVRRQHVERVAPQDGWIKFNVNGEAQGNLGPVVIGGIMRDKDGCIPFKFSRALGIRDLSIAKILAIKEAFQIFVGLMENHVKLWVENDSLNVVS
ncbi:Uncharacterized protein TCM_002421 [Theobroma cacao]|uniref:RNase H type-1 domain-containing protein n=1 Tax=Theobroma cacao TaxID=3641 RepID=A0A061DN73_THECC|nr:Uncharacterized protein TCM_002421 [Theobroma cacao]